MSALTETQERFLRDAAQRLPVERVREAYVFAPLRQGGVETGVAVLAVAPPPPEPPAAEAEESAAAAEGVEAAAADEATSAEGAQVEAPGEEAAAEAMTEAAVDAGEPPTEAEDDDAPAESIVEAIAASPPVAEPFPEMPDAVPLGAPLDAVLEAEPAVEPVPANEEEPPPEATRHTVYTARYRLQLKGPDRGKWEVDVVEEADAPLVTVDEVVRGVQRRAGDASEVERLDAVAFRALVEGVRA